MCSKDASVPEDELEKLRSALIHAYDKKKPFARRLIEAMRGRSRAPKRVIRLGAGKKKKSDKDAA